MASDTNDIRDFRLGLSPFYSSTERESVSLELKRFILLNATPGSRVHCDDAYNLRTISQITIPSLRYDSPANRQRLLGQSLTVIGAWLATTNDGPTGTLRVPEYLDFVSADGLRTPRTVILIGSPMARYEDEPTFSMSGSEEGPRVPSDGHLLSGLQSTPYGTAERKGRLRNCRVTWCYLSESTWSNALHRVLTQRFWTLFTAQQGGVLTAFSPDMQSVFRAAGTRDSSPVQRADVDSSDTKIEMRIARARLIPTWLPQQTAKTNDRASTREGAEGVLPAEASAERAVSETAATLDTSQPIDAPVHIGIMWHSSDRDLDVDLYVQVSDYPELYYRQLTCPAGTYVHDWRQPNSTADFEWVRLRPPVRLDEVTAWVNLFKGTGPISGTVAVHFENKIFVGSFSIPATRGNGGRDARKRERSPNWAPVDLHRLVLQPR